MTSGVAAKTRAPKKLGQLLFDRGLITQTDVDQALALQKEAGILFGEALLRIGAISEEHLLESLSEQLQIPILADNARPDSIDPITTALERLGLDWAWATTHQAIVWWNNDELVVAALRPLAPQLLESIEHALWRAKLFSSTQIRVFMAKSATIEQYFLQSEASENANDDSDFSLQKLREMAEEAPVIDFVNRLFERSMRKNASDIHIEPAEAEFEIRVRVDGTMRSDGKFPKSKFDAVVSRIKILSGMDIAEQRLPQDGRQTIRLSGERVDLRVSSLPGTNGESIVVRLLRKDVSLPGLQELGLQGYAEQALNRALTHNNGVILMTGPTGSGKSTTLHKILERLDDGNRKIITIEDPVEYEMPNITQIQVRSEIGYTFKDGLRSILRHDPDVIMVGEIRDGETATIAAQAALTGHIVFSTLHTNSALGAIERLVDLGLDRFLVASSARAFASQRLARKICSSCATPSESPMGEDLIRQSMADGAKIQEALKGPSNWVKANGCDACEQTGYSGRVGVYEVVPVDDNLRSQIGKGGDENEYVRQLRSDGYLTLFEDGLIKAYLGMTTVDEVLRVAGNANLEPVG